MSGTEHVSYLGFSAHTHDMPHACDQIADLISEDTTVEICAFFVLMVITCTLCVDGITCCDEGVPEAPRMTATQEYLQSHTEGSSIICAVSLHSRRPDMSLVHNLMELIMIKAMSAIS